MGDSQLSGIPARGERALNGHHDPFAAADLDRTLIGDASPGASSASVLPHTLARGAIGSRAGLNPLLAVANRVLGLVPGLRTTLVHPDPASLREHLVSEMRDFESGARAAGIDPLHARAASYALCTLVDEVAASTPWGGSGLWARQSLLVLFHNETWGGEKFFQLLSRLAESPAENRALLELMYVCLALGLEGRYRVTPEGRAQLDSLRERLALMLLEARGGYERDLSPRWRSPAVERQDAPRSVPWWTGAALLAIVVTVAYVGFAWQLNALSDPVYAAIRALQVQSPEHRLVAHEAGASPLAKFLAPEIAAGLVAVKEDARSSVVTILGDSLFAPGSAGVSANTLPLLARIADALAAVPGRVLVTGHTDDTPIRSFRFPSNSHLSQERARAIVRTLERKLPAARLAAEGRADAEPIAPNDTAANRGRNRRVEISVSHDTRPPGGTP